MFWSRIFKREQKNHDGNEQPSTAWCGLESFESRVLMSASPAPAEPPMSPCDPVVEAIQVTSDHAGTGDAEQDLQRGYTTCKPMDQATPLLFAQQASDDGSMDAVAGWSLVVESPQIGVLFSESPQPAQHAFIKYIDKATTPLNTLAGTDTYSDPNNPGVADDAGVVQQDPSVPFDLAATKAYVTGCSMGGFGTWNSVASASFSNPLDLLPI